MPIGGEIEKGNRLAGLDEDFADKLGEFVRNGGGLVIACGDKVKESVDQVEVADAGGARKWEPRFAYNRVFGSGGAKLLPFDFKGVQETTELNSYSLAPETVAVPSFVDRFRQAPFPDVLRLVTIHQLMDVDESNPQGRVLIRTTGVDRPFLASRVMGEGEVILVTTSLDESWGKFPSEARAFVPFTRDLVAHLTSRRVPGGTATAGIL